MVIIFMFYLQKMQNRFEMHTFHGKTEVFYLFGNY